MLVMVRVHRVCRTKKHGPPKPPPPPSEVRIMAQANGMGGGGRINLGLEIGYLLMWDHRSTGQP